MDQEEEVQTHEYFPYLEQAGQLARRQISKEGSTNVANNEDDDNNADESEMSSFSSTICVNYRHLHSYDPDLAEAIEGEYVRFEPFLRRAAKEFVLSYHPELDRAIPGGGGGMMKEGGIVVGGALRCTRRCCCESPIGDT